MICTFLTAIVFLVILGLTVGISFTKADDQIEDAEKPGKVKRLLETQIDQMEVLFIIHIGIHLVLLITTGIITTVIYCNYEEDESGHLGSTVVSVKPTQSRLAHIKDQRTYTSQSFHYAGFHERLSPIQTASQDNLDIVQDRKLPTLPNSNFEPIHSTAKRDPAFIRSAPNLNRLHSVNPYSHPLPPKSTDESTSGDSNEANEKSPLIRNHERQNSTNLNYSRRKLCTSMTEEEILKPTDYSRSPIRARKSPIRSISEASAFVASLSQENPPKIPPRPHERPNKTVSNHNVSFEIQKSKPLDEEIYENPVNKHLCKTRLITVPEPSEADEDSMGYTKIKEEPETSNIQEIQDKVCHV